MTKEQFIERLAQRIFRAKTFLGHSDWNNLDDAERATWINAATEAYRMVEAQIDLFGPPY